MKPNRFASLAPGSLQPKAKRKKPTPKAKTPEAAIQAQVEAYIEAIGLASFHIPDALLRAGFAQGKPVSYALINAAAEVRGFPDLIIFDPMRHGFVLCLELKTSIGTMTANQRQWQKTVGSRLCRSFEEAKAEIDEWMKDRRQELEDALPKDGRAQLGIFHKRACESCGAIHGTTIAGGR